MGSVSHPDVVVELGGVEAGGVVAIGVVSSCDAGETGSAGEEQAHAQTPRKR